MKKTIIIIGMGQGLSFGVAQKFGKEGYNIGMISRSSEKLEGFKNQLASLGITSEFAPADVADTAQMVKAIRELKSKLGVIHVLHYNAVDYRYVHILKETVEELSTGFKISVANAFAASMELRDELKQNNGAILFTGGGSGNNPSPDMASISLGKAGIKNLTLQLHQALKPEGIFVGTVVINGAIDPASAKYSPDNIANKFWELNEKRGQVEIVY